MPLHYPGRTFVPCLLGTEQAWVVAGQTQRRFCHYFHFYEHLDAIIKVTKKKKIKMTQKYVTPGDHKMSRMSRNQI
jgi:hypothetical protein